MHRVAEISTEVWLTQLLLACGGYLQQLCTAAAAASAAQHPIGPRDVFSWVAMPNSFSHLLLVPHAALP